MDEQELLRQAANAPTMYFDGFSAFRKINGVVRCVGYIVGSGAQLNLVISLTGVEAGITDARRALDEKRPTAGFATMDRMKLAH